MVEQLEPALADAKDAAAGGSSGADLVEFRLDPSMDVDVRTAIGTAQRLVDESPVPCIVTCRHAREGGAWEGDEADRIELFEAVCDGLRTPAYIDIEFASWRTNPELQRRILAALARTDNATGLILSAHDFSTRPANLFSLLRDMQSVEQARVIKIAFRARSVRDTLDVAEILAHADRPTIALAMGEAGTPSRILAGKWGGFLTFASVRDEAATAPGQPTVRELIDTYRFRTVGPSTRVFGVIGWPVTHSIGWRIHNAVFEAMGFDGVYMRLPVAPEWESFKATVLSLLDDPRFGLGGVSVTLPHKEHLVRLAREDRSRAWEIDPIAAAVGAANTLAVRAGGSCWIGNTDVEGVIAPLSSALGGAVQGRAIAVLGAGGAARAAAIGLASAGASVTVFARRADRASAIAADGAALPGSIAGAPWEQLPAWRGDAVVHCTPVGMEGGPEPDRSPVDESVVRGWGPGVVVMDTVYRPVETALVRVARAAGCPVVPGTAMYAVQASGQIRAWTGSSPPEGLIERILDGVFASPSHP
jgi:3-dehydroquinate dehydratase/shikimate dehydrogenase